MEIKLDHGEHARFLVELGASVAAIQHQLELLDTVVESLHIDWSGDAQDAYRSAQSEWTKAMSVLRASLARARDGAADAGRRLLAAEEGVRSIWD